MKVRIIVIIIHYLLLFRYSDTAIVSYKNE